MKRSEPKNKANRTKNPKDDLRYKQQRYYFIKSKNNLRSMILII